MSNVSRFPPRLSIVGGREIKGAADFSPIKPALVSSYPLTENEQYKRHERQQLRLIDEKNEHERRSLSSEDRRKANLRARQQTMLVEFRSGRNRRRYYQRGSDVVIHIDEKA